MYSKYNSLTSRYKKAYMNWHAIKINESFG